MPEPRSQSARACLRRALCPVVNGHRVALFFTGRKHAGREPRRCPGPTLAAIGRPHSNVRRPRRKYLTSACVPSWPIAFLMPRRRYVDVVAELSRGVPFVLETLREVYHNDQLARQRGLSAEDRLAFHQAESAPHMKSLEDWMKAQFEERKNRAEFWLGEAIQYTQKPLAAGCTRIDGLRRRSSASADGAELTPQSSLRGIERGQRFLYSRHPGGLGRRGCLVVRRSATR